MAPPPLPPDYSAGAGATGSAPAAAPAPAPSNNTAAAGNPSVAGGWSKPMAQTTTGDDDWGNAGWGLPPVKSNNAQQPQQQQQQQAANNDYQAGGAAPGEASSSATSFFSPASNAVSSNANTNQVTGLSWWINGEWPHFVFPHTAIFCRPPSM